MENINNAFDNAMEKICSKCVAKASCKFADTKCAEYEVLLAIKNELNETNAFIEECDKLVADIEAKENACKEKGVCPVCGGKYDG